MTANGLDNKWIGKRTPRPDGADKVTGRAAFGADFSQPGMLVGRVLRDELEAAFVAEPFAAKGLETRHVFTEELVLITPKDHAPVATRIVKRAVQPSEEAPADGWAAK